MVGRVNAHLSQEPFGPTHVEQAALQSLHLFVEFAY